MEDKEVLDNYENFWKEIVENPDGTINKDQIAKELYDFSRLISNLSSLYSYITGGMVSKPMTNVSAVTSLFEEELQEAYKRGYEDAKEDLKDDEVPL